MTDIFFDTSVIVPTRNRHILLRRAIVSIQNQSVHPKTIIVVDDASQVLVVREKLETLTDIPLLILRNDESKGGSRARNQGVENAKTEYVSFLDDDDAWESNYLETHMCLSSKGAKAIFSRKKFVLSTSLDKVFREVDIRCSATYEDLLNGNAVGSTSSVSIEKTLLEKVDNFDESLPALQDYDLWLRVSKVIDFIGTNETSLIYTVNVSSNKEAQISGNFLNHLKAYELLIEKYTNKLPPKELEKLSKTLNYFIAKAIHRKNYWQSLRYTNRSIFHYKHFKSIFLLIPYKILNKLGVYTS